jgi:hypothetical protein
MLSLALVFFATPAFPLHLQEERAGRRTVESQTDLKAKIKQLQKEKVQAAKEDVDVRNRQLEAGFGISTVCFLLDASRRLALAQLETSEKTEDQTKALQTHFDTTKSIQELDQARFDAGRLSIEALSSTKSFRLEAEIWLERVKAGKLKPVVSVKERAAGEQEKVTPSASKGDFELKLQKLLQAQVETAKAEVEGRMKQFEVGRGTLDFLLSSSRRLVIAEMQKDERKPDRLRALESHLKRTRRIEEIMEDRFNKKADEVITSEIDVSEAICYRLEAEILLEGCKAGILKKLDSSGEDGLGKEEILAKSPLSMKLQELLQAQVGAARVEAEGRMKQFEEGRGTLDFLLASSRRLLQVELEAADKKPGRLKSLQAHFDRMKKVQDINQERWNQGRIALQDVDQAKYYRLEAEIWLERAKGGEGKTDR